MSPPTRPGTPGQKLLVAIETIAARMDVRVVRRRVGPPGQAANVAARRGIVPDDLLDLWAEVGPVSFQWELIDAPDLGGAVALDPAEASGFAHDESFAFPADVEHLFVDMHSDGVHAHYVKRVGEPLAAAHLVAAAPMDEEDAKDVGVNLAAYVDRLVEWGFAPGWPEGRASAKKVKARLAKAAKAPKGWYVGARAFAVKGHGVDANCNRGTVVALASGRGAEAPEVVRVAFDHGPEMWIGTRVLKAMSKKPDAYEDAFDDAPAFFARLLSASPEGRAEALRPIVLRSPSLTLAKVTLGPDFPEALLEDFNPNDVGFSSGDARVYALVRRLPEAERAATLLTLLEGWVADDPNAKRLATEVVKGSGYTERELLPPGWPIYSTPIRAAMGAFGLIVCAEHARAPFTKLGDRFSAPIVDRVRALVAAIAKSEWSGGGYGSPVTPFIRVALARLPETDVQTLTGTASFEEAAKAGLDATWRACWGTA